PALNVYIVGEPVSKLTSTMYSTWLVTPTGAGATVNVPPPPACPDAQPTVVPDASTAPGTAVIVGGVATGGRPATLVSVAVCVNDAANAPIVALGTFTVSVYVPATGAVPNIVKPES